MTKKVASIFNSIGGVFWLIAFLVCKDNAESNLGGEIWTQGLVLTILEFVLCCIPFLGWLLEIVVVVMIVISVVHAAKGEDTYGVFLINKLGWNWFKNI